MYCFVYGTLRKGHSNHRLLEGSRFVGEATTSDHYYMLDSGFPVLLDPEDSRPGYRVRGEVYEVDKETMSRLDDLEGEGMMYDRVRRYVRLDSGMPLRLYYYVGVPQFWNPRRRPQLQPTGMAGLEVVHDWQ